MALNLYEYATKAVDPSRQNGHQMVFKILKINLKIGFHKCEHDKQMKALANVRPHKRQHVLIQMVYIIRSGMGFGGQVRRYNI